MSFYKYGWRLMKTPMAPAWFNLPKKTTYQEIIFALNIKKMSFKNDKYHSERFSSICEKNWANSLNMGGAKK